MTPRDAAPWLLLIHQLPPRPAYLRVKVSRRLQKLGAVALKNTVYVLPNGSAAREHLQWVRREISKDGGEATVCEARFVDGMRHGDVVRLFRSAREPDWRSLADEARRLAQGRRDAGAAALARMRQRREEIAALDFFGAPSRPAAEQAIAALERSLKERLPSRRAVATLRTADFRGRTWVTRRGVHVDRMSSAWLIRRFIDPKARFRFVDPEGFVPAAREVRFDMFEGEFAHESDSCTFETLVARFGLDDPALAAVAEVIHDIDLRDGHFAREETSGIEGLVNGIWLTCGSDEERLARSGPALDALYAWFRRKAERAGGKRRGAKR